MHSDTLCTQVKKKHHVKALHSSARCLTHPSAGVTKRRVLEGGVVVPSRLVPATKILYCTSNAELKEGRVSGMQGAGL